MKLYKNQKGQSIVEYVILVALVSLVCVGATKTLGRKINAKIKDVNNLIDTGINVRQSPNEKQETSDHWTGF